MEIYFRDLNPDAQKRFLEFTKTTSESDGNWEVMPIAIISKPEEENE